VWVEEIVWAHCMGHVYLCRYADDFVCAFQNGKDAQRFYQVLSQRLARYGLEVAEDKTQMMEFSLWKARAKTKFDFLGFESVEKAGLKAPYIQKQTQGICCEFQRMVSETLCFVEENTICKIK
jgi:hypothetical protein